MKGISLTLHPRSQPGIVVAALLAALFAPCPVAWSQDAANPNAVDAGAATDGSPRESNGAPGDAAAERGPDVPMVELDLPENVELEVLVEFIGKRNGINFLYNENLLANKRLTLKAPNRLPADSLTLLLESALKAQNLLLVPTDVPGVMTIEQASQQLPKLSRRVTREGEAIDPDEAVTVVTRVFELEHLSPEEASPLLQPFLSVTNAIISPLPRRDLLIVTDFAGNMTRIEEVIDLLDQPGREAEVEFVPLEHVDSASVVQKVTQILQARAQAMGAARGGLPVAMVAEQRSNQVVVLGPRDEVDRAVALMRSFDVPSVLQTRVYRFTTATPDDIDSLVNETIGGTAGELYRSVILEETNQLVVIATPEIHLKVEELTRLIDRPIEEQQSPIRFYKLQNAKADDVLDTLSNLEGDAGLGDVSVDGVGTSPATGNNNRETEVEIRGPTGTDVNPSFGRTGRGQGGSVDLPDARVIADVPTNTIIIVAPPAIQAIYERLIERLDVRRPQVLIEATIVSIDTTDDFSLGVQFFTQEDGVDGGELIFSNAGLSAPTVASGALGLAPGTGFTAALLNAASAEVVIEALQRDTRARVMSRPSVLVNDNETGRLVRNDEEPFSSLNTIDGVTTVSLGGFAEAGTEVQVTPQISEGDHLQLEYSLILSSFTSPATDTLPPGRQTNEIESVATIPDGYTIVVGGLTLENDSETINRVPLLGEIPVLEYVFSSRDIDRSETTLFVFIKGTILRDDKFEDLKSISLDASRRIELEQNYPTSVPVAID